MKKVSRDAPHDDKPWMIASLARGLQILELIAQRQCGDFHNAMSLLPH
jgi:hypothetical protein